METRLLPTSNVTGNFRAKHAAICPTCNKAINIGDLITWNRRVQGVRWHLECYDPSIAEEQAQKFLRGEKLELPTPVETPTSTTPATSSKIDSLLVAIRAIVKEELNASNTVTTVTDITKHEFVHSQREMVLELVKDLGLNVYMKGAAGSGKTHVAHQIAELMGTTLVPMQFDGFTSPILIKGYMDAQGRFSSTPIYDWLKSDGGILFIDELDRGREDTLVCLNSLLANKYQMFANGEVLQMTSKHYVIAAGNTSMRGSDGNYTSARKQDASVLDRFVVVEWSYDTSMELKLAESINTDHGVSFAKWIHRVRAYVSNPANGIKTNIVVGMRAILFGATLLKLERYQNNKALLVQLVLLKYGVDDSTVARIMAIQ